MDSSLNRLAKKLSDGPQVAPVPNFPQLSVGRGVIVTNPGGGKVTLYLDGGTTAVSADRLASAGTFSVGTIVECLIVGTRIIVLGPFGG
jgi:hypothetical protein